MKKVFDKFVNGCVTLVNKYLPDAFIFAVILTIFVFVVAIFVTGVSPDTVTTPAVENVPFFERFMNLVYTGWYGGFWSLLAFSMQMALVVVTGSILANTPQVHNALVKLAKQPKTPGGAVFLVTFVGIVVAFINWGAALIVGGILAKEIARQLKGVHYALLVAAGYIGIGMWHGGFSGSIPLMIATPTAAGSGVFSISGGATFPLQAFNQSIFAPYNLFIYVVGLAVLPFVVKAMHPSQEKTVPVNPAVFAGEVEEPAKKARKEMTPAEKLENSHVLNWIIVILGFLAIVWYFVKMVRSGASFSLDLNMVNFMFLFISMALYGTPIKTVRAVNSVASGAAGVILQFPFYAGIAGMMVYAGGSSGVSIAKVVSDFFINISNATTFPLLVWLSAGIVNFFVPSGGGQWAVQAPLVMPAAQTMGLNLGKAAMSIAWGDCWTNLIQPFWALPLLAVAKLGAKDIMGYCIVCLLVLGVIIAIGMLIPAPAVAALLLA